MRERERERVRERERECVCVCVRERERERVCVCVCVFSRSLSHLIAAPSTRAPRVHLPGLQLHLQHATKSETRGTHNLRTLLF